MVLSLALFWTVRYAQSGFNTPCIGIEWLVWAVFRCLSFSCYTVWHIVCSEMVFCIPMRGYVCFCHLSVSFSQSGPSPPLSLTTCSCPQNCCSLEVFSFFHNSLQTLETVVHENPRRSAVSEKPPSLAPTVIPRLKSLRSHFFPILSFGLKNSRTMWPCLHALMHSVASTWLAD